ncbi:MAG: DNA-processing protein DprA [Prevotella sp.]|jgi:DNA processing protein|nr:DNA-processing protein DprA [Prevotella sp.]
MNEEIYYSIALTRMTGFNAAMALQLYQALGSSQAVYEHRNDVGDVLPDATPRLREAMKNWDDALKRAAAEMEFITKKGIRAFTMQDADYPQRLCECPDAPILLYYIGSADLNQRYVLNVVGTRQCTSYGKDMVRSFLRDLRQQCPQVLVVSGLAYGIDICAHRNALELGYETVGVLAHGLDQIYPYCHRDDAVRMLRQGGLLTEYMSQTEALPNNFRQRNRIVAGISDATVLVESAYKGGGLITCRIAQEYGRDVFAFPGAVGMPYSEGCNRMIRNNTAALIMSAEDFLESMRWQTVSEQPETVERQLFPDLTPEERKVVDILQQTNDLQLNILSVKSNIPIGQLTALLFQMEMKGIIKPLAGGTYHLVH